MNFDYTPFHRPDTCLYNMMYDLCIQHSRLVYNACLLAYFAPQIFIWMCMWCGHCGENFLVKRISSAFMPESLMAYKHTKRWYLNKHSAVVVIIAAVVFCTYNSYSCHRPQNNFYSNHMKTIRKYGNWKHIRIHRHMRNIYKSERRNKERSKKKKQSNREKKDNRNNNHTYIHTDIQWISANVRELTLIKYFIRQACTD